MFVQLHQQPAAILVVEFAEKKGRECEIHYNNSHQRTRFSDLAHIVSFSDERIPFASMEAELTKQGVYHSGTAIEANAIGLSIWSVHLKISPISNPYNQSNTLTVYCRGTKGLFYSVQHSVNSEQLG